MYRLRKKDFAPPSAHGVAQQGNPPQFLPEGYKGCCLFADPRTPPNRLVITALEELGDKIDYTLVAVDLSELEHKSDLIMRLNPRGKVPILSDEGGKYICTESWAIVEYLSQNYQQVDSSTRRKQLYPPSLLVRARVDQINFVSNELMQLVLEEYPNIRGVLFRGAKPSQDGAVRVREFLDFYDHFLSQRPRAEEREGEDEEERKADGDEYRYLACNHYNCADIFAAIPLLTVCTTVETEDQLFSTHPRVHAWFNRVTNRSSFRRANQQATDDFAKAYRDALRGQTRGVGRLNFESYQPIYKNIKRFVLAE